MGSVHRQEGSAIWNGAFRTSDGRRRLRSTGTTDKKTVLEIVRSWEMAVALGSKGGLTSDKAAKS